MRLHWIDPLNIVYRRLHAGADWKPPEYLRQNFGSADHYRLLTEELAKRPANGSLTILDFLPFSRLPNLHLLTGLHQTPDVSRLIILCSNPSAKADICAFDERLTSQIVSVEPGKKGPSFTNAPQALLAIARNLGAITGEGQEELFLLSMLRRAANESWLQEYVQEHTILGSTAEWAEGACRVRGRQYLRMANQMLVTHFVNMKSLLSDVQRIDALAYEVAWHSCCGFVPAAHGFWPDLLIAANDHSFLVGAAAQRLCGVPCAVIDRIGILPGRNLTRDTVSQDVADKSVVLISELSATASEIERAVSLLVQRGARVALIICCVWFECAFPRFVDALPFIGLCRPKRRLQFIYRSAE